MKIRHSTWYAAGPEISRALTLLSDGAFRLYVFLCLQAKRDTGEILISYATAAKALDRSRRSINAYFDELRTRGVCMITAGSNQHENNKIEICDEFWPYAKIAKAKNSIELSSYLQRIGQLLSARVCVKCGFGGADRALAASYFDRRISIEQIEHAIALGCSRKYASWLNGAHTEPIVSFHYFADVVEEACSDDVPAGYWDYVMPTLKKLEARWVAGQVVEADA